MADQLVPLPRAPNDLSVLLDVAYKPEIKKRRVPVARAARRQDLCLGPSVACSSPGCARFHSASEWLAAPRVGKCAVKTSAVGVWASAIQAACILA